MEIDVGAYIADLLYENEMVNLPGLGGFVGKYHAAAIDHVQGKIQPPGKDLSFNTNLKLNDGVLVNYLQEKHDLSLSAAQKTVEDFVEGVRQALNKKEIVVFPKLGRIYQDYEGNIKFVSEGTNFNKNSYGLPAVQFYPLSRIEGRPTPPGSTTPPKEVKTSHQKKSTPSWIEKMEQWFDQNIALIVAVAAVVLAFTAWWFFLRDSGPVQEPDDPIAEKVPSERYNVKPSMEAPASEEIEAEGTTPADMENTTDNTQNIDTEEPTIAPGQKSGIILIGVFGNPDNVERLVRKIYEAGFEPFTEPRGNLTRVGIQFAYETEAQLQRNLKDVQDKFEPKAKIIKR